MKELLILWNGQKFLVNMVTTAMASIRILLWNVHNLLPWKLELNYFLVDENINIVLILETHHTEQYSLSHSHKFKIFNAVHLSGKAQRSEKIFRSPWIPLIL